MLSLLPHEHRTFTAVSICRGLGLPVSSPRNPPPHPQLPLPPPPGHASFTRSGLVAQCKSKTLALTALPALLWPLTHACPRWPVVTATHPALARGAHSVFSACLPAQQSLEARADTIIWLLFTDSSLAARSVASAYCAVRTEKGDNRSSARTHGWTDTIWLLSIEHYITWTFSEYSFACCFSNGL